MYHVEGLRRQCETLLIENLSTSNAVEHFQLACLHGGLLKTAALDFITENFQEIEASPEWAQLDPGVVKESFGYLAKKLNA